MVLMTSGQPSCPLACHLLTPICLPALALCLPHVAQILARLCLLHFLFPLYHLQYCSTESKAGIPRAVSEALCNGPQGSPFALFSLSVAREEAQRYQREITEKGGRAVGLVVIHLINFSNN